MSKNPYFCSKKLTMALQEKYINPFTDYGFKKLFGTEVNKDLLIDFLNQVLPDKHHIEDLSYTSTEQLGATEMNRKAVFDLYCISPEGERFIVEIQKAKQNYFKDRSVYYATFPIQEQAKKGNWDFRLSAVYTVGILDFVFEDDREGGQVRHEVKLKDQDCQVFYDKLTFIYLEMPHFRKSEAELESNFDKWMYVLRHLPDLQGRPAALQERVFQKLFEAAEIARFEPEERAQYEESLKHYRDLKNVVDTSFEEGLAEGMEKGREEGIQQIILNAYKAGLEVETIAHISGKTPAEVREVIERFA
jgi:predicted transposase/invertase (TIGR01784 family)